MKKLHFALIGMGGMGSRWAGIISKLASLDAVVDSSDKRSATLDDVLSDPYIDAVLIATPHGDLAWQTKKALKAGKHVLCEKPGAIHSRDIKKNIKIAKKKGLVYVVSYNHRFHEGFLEARYVYERKYIGDIIFIRSRYGFGGRKGYNKEWRLNKKKGGSGELMDQGVHMIDMVMSFIGKPVEIRGFTSDKFWKKGNKDIGEDNGFVLLKGKNKEIASIHASLTQWKPLHNFEIYGTKGYISVEGLGQRYGGTEIVKLCRRPKDFSRDVQETVVRCNPIADNSLIYVLENFIDVVGGKKKTQMTGENAYEVLRVVEKIYKQNK